MEPGAVSGGRSGSYRICIIAAPRLLYQKITHLATLLNRNEGVKLKIFLWSGAVVFLEQLFLG